MTLHIAFVCNSYVLLVGDRLLTVAHPSGDVERWDPFANKTIVLMVRNGRVALSYAGLAHIDGLSTDEWLLEIITRQKAVEGMTPGSRSMQFGGTLDLTLRDVFTRVRDGIDQRLLLQGVRPQDKVLEVIVTGWTWPRDVGQGNARPSTITRTITHTGKRRDVAEVDTMRRRRYLQASTGWDLWSIGAGRRSYLQRVTDRARVAARTVADDVERIIVEEIRRAAGSPRTTIGTDLVSVYLPITDAENPRVRYFWDTARAHPSNAFSPSLVVANRSSMIIHPSLIIGAPPSFAWGDAKGQQLELEVVPPIIRSGPQGFTSQVRRPAP